MSEKLILIHSRELQTLHDVYALLEDVGGDLFSCCALRRANLSHLVPEYTWVSNGQPVRDAWLDEAIGADFDGEHPAVWKQSYQAVVNLMRLYIFGAYVALKEDQLAYPEPD
jgi:hypothetical protein